MTKNHWKRMLGRPVVIAIAVAVFGVLAMLIVDHGPWTRPKVQTAEVATQLPPEAGDAEERAAIGADLALALLTTRAGAIEHGVGQRPLGRASGEDADDAAHEFTTRRSLATVKPATCWGRSPNSTSPSSTQACASNPRRPLRTPRR